MSMEMHYYYLDRSDNDGVDIFEDLVLVFLILYVICHFRAHPPRYGAETTYSRLRVSCSNW